MIVREDRAPARLALMLAVALGCAGSASAATGDGAPVFVREGPGIARGALVFEGSFRRAGLMWDASPGTRIEGRTDAGAWREFVLSFGEQGAHVGYLDADPAPAERLELRVIGPDGSDAALSFLRVELLGEVEREAGAAPPVSRAPRAGAPVEPRSAWGAREPLCVSYHTPERITVHHTATPTNDTLTPDARLRQIQSYHMDVNGWCDIGYHFLVARDGSRWQGRDETWIGAHTGGANTNNVGVAFLGTHTSAGISSGQLSSAGTLLRWLRDTYGIAASSELVKGHRDYGSTECPGDALYGQLPELIAEMADDGGGGGCGGAVSARATAPGSTLGLLGGLAALALRRWRRRVAAARPAAP